ncbi:MAG TPA: hypothetical protein VN181_04100 [Thermoanaerobaculia bacterium]|nr:hypothetical protein [Thermoanaerobaculia bacterium]
MTQISGDSSQIEWDRGPQGDTSWPWATGSTSVMFCPAAPTTLVSP